jgi:4-hydroxy-4-methyl-2-oxoglutarate aldolase
MEILRGRVEEIARIGTGPISDAMDLLRLPRRVITGWQFVASEPLAAIVGPAFTVRQAVKGRGGDYEENRTRQGEVAAGLARPGDVVVIDVGARIDVATWGETYSVQALARGVAGLVVNGAVRDSSRIRRAGFPVLCRGFSPVGSRWDLETVALNEPVTIGGILIRPGDLIYGDADGVIAIPREQAGAVFDRALAIQAAEERLRGGPR